MSNNSSINGNRHNYLRIEKWETILAFWRDGNYSDQTKERYENWLIRWRAQSRIKQDEIKRAHL